MHVCILCLILVFDICFVSNFFFFGDALVREIHKIARMRSKVGEDKHAGAIKAGNLCCNYGSLCWCPFLT